MKIKLSIVLSAAILGVFLFGIFVFAGNLFGLNKDNTGFIKVSGRIEGTEYQVAAKVAGKVIDLEIEEGTKVRKGEQIAVIESPQLSAIIDQAKSYLRKAELNVKLSKIEFNRSSRLLQEKAIQKQIYDEAESEYLSAKEDLLAAKNELHKLSADLADTKITAPISGIIVTKIVQAGEVVGVGTPLVTIINMDDLFLKAFLPTETAGRVSLGDEAQIFPDAFPEETYDAFVSKVAGKAEFTPKNVETRSQRANLVFEIKLKVKKNTEHRLKPGMPAEALIKISAR